MVVLESLSAGAVSKPVSGPVDPEYSFQSLDQAAIAALNWAFQKSKSVEYAGCLYSIDQVYRFTEPVSNFMPESFSITCEIPSGPNAMLLGFYHTHPENYEDGVSGPDLETAQKFMKTSYIGILNSKKVVKYVPGKTKIKCLSASSLSCSPANRYSPGDFVGRLTLE